MERSLPYGLTGLGLVVGLAVIVLGPFPKPILNYLVGGSFLAVAIVSVTVLIVEFSDPDERRPDF
ncbi:MAG: hypothetical protein V5A18_05180 [Haloarculaceae archaeon]|nr:hypothetical protein [Halodesulfurarchaeum sp.]